MPAKDGTARLSEAIEKYRSDPVGFVRDMFGVEPVAWQAEALVDYVENDRLAVKSGHGVGKSTFLAWLVIYNLLTKYPCKIACTAPSAHQLNDVLWSEISIWHRRLPEAFKALLEVKAETIVLTAAPKESFAVARVARRETPEALQGFHAKHMVFLIDEASGVDEQIFIVGEGSMSSPGAKVVMTGNPTRAAGYFFNAFHRDRNRWKCRTVSTADVDGPHVDKSYGASLKEAYGEESNIYRVRVLGDFPTADDDAVIPLDWLESAIARDIQPDGPVVWGIDPARFGDDRTAFAIRQGHSLLQPVKSWRQADLMTTADRIYFEFSNAQQRPEMILVDAIGVGSGVADRLKQMGLPVRGVNVSESPAVKEKYMRLRDELWFRLREWLETLDCSLPDDPDLVSELTNVKYSFQPSGKIKVESKDEIKKRTGGKSPDLADALIMTFAAPTVMSFWNKPIDYGKNHVSAMVV